MNFDMKPDAIKKIRAVVADDSPFVCKLLKRFLESDPGIEVVKTARNGNETIQAIKDYNPDVLTLDLVMPDMNGLEVLQCLMSECPLPVVVISGGNKKAAALTRQAISLGAADFVVKYSTSHATNPEILMMEIISKVKSAAQTKTIRTIKSMKERFAHPNPAAAPIQFPSQNRMPDLQYVIIGASTGGPLAIKELLGALKSDFSFTTIVVQHMPEGFTATLASQLDRILPFPVREAVHNNMCKPGEVVIAKGDHHLTLEDDGRIKLIKVSTVNDYCSSIDKTMQSAAFVYGKRASGILLSRMGDDGVKGLQAIKEYGGRTFTQSPESCVIDTMPDFAVKHVNADRTGTPSEIGRWIC